jgi:4-oxalocrotonate tautomerase family enzyme
MPYVFISMLDRGLKKKRAAVKGVTEALVKAYAIPPEWVHVVITDITEDQIAVGGALLSDKEKKHALTAKKRKKAKR